MPTELSLEKIEPKYFSDRNYKDSKNRGLYGPGDNPFKKRREMGGK